MKVEWKISDSPVDYQEALDFMEARVAAIQKGEASELVWLLEHPSVYTCGTSAKSHDILDSSLCPVIETGRGGQVTYHGPGQRIIYLMLDLNKRGKDVRKYVKSLENMVISTLSQFGIRSQSREGRVGIWICDGSREEKIAAIGVRVKQWVTMHGVSINVNPDMSFYRGIVPCGISDHGVTSMERLGVEADFKKLDLALQSSFEREFKSG